MEPSVDARDWGRRQAAASPRWSEDKWRRVAAILGMKLAPPESIDRGQTRDDEHTEAA
jgi:hypothetical protein